MMKSDPTLRHPLTRHFTTNKHYPDHDVWNRAHYYGSIILRGIRVDLGLYFSSDAKDVSYANVYGPDPWEYASGLVYHSKGDPTQGYAPSRYEVTCESKIIVRDLYEKAGLFWGKPGGLRC